MLKKILSSIRSSDEKVYALTRSIRKLSSIKATPQGRLKIFPLLDQLVSRLGFVLYNQSLCWVNDPDFKELWFKSPYLYKQRTDRKFIAYSSAMSVRHLTGDTAECGVLDGATSYLILNANQGTHKHHFMFDSWQGLSEPIDFDKDLPDDSAFRWTQGDLTVDIDLCKENLLNYNNKTFYKGWIPNEFFHVESKIFSFVHIDVDLYEPTLDSLKFFWPRMQDGAVLICDDYGSESCPGAKKACDEFFMSQLIPRSMIHLTSGQGLIIK